MMFAAFSYRYFCASAFLVSGRGGGVMTEVIVQVPDGIYGGDEFTIEYEGTVLSVVCPAGCQPGDEINLSIDLPPAAASGSVEVVVPEGCYPGMEFTVELGERSFNIAVPDGCEPGQAIMIQVPEDGPGTADAASDDERTQGGQDLAQELVGQWRSSSGLWSCEACTFLNEPSSTACEICGAPRGGLDSEEATRQRQVQEQRDADLAKSLQGEELRASANEASVARESTSAWAAPAGTSDTPSCSWGSGSSSQPTSLFAIGVGTGDGTFGNPAGDFHVGQLVQVSRSDGSWTYGKIMAYDAGGDTYSVMTRAGAKHFVERSYLTDDVVVNPSDGSCAQQ